MTDDRHLAARNRLFEVGCGVRIFMIDDVETELQNLYKKSTGKNLVISTETKDNGNSGKNKGWGEVPQTTGTQRKTDDEDIYKN